MIGTVLTSLSILAFLAVVPFIGKLNPWNSAPVPLLLTPTNESVIVPNTTNITLPEEFFNSSILMCPLPSEMVCFRGSDLEFVFEENNIGKENSTAKTSEVISLCSHNNEKKRNIWKEINISPVALVICLVLILFVLDIPWWRQFAEKVYAFLTEGKRTRKELEETKLLLQLEKEESEAKQKELQELQQQLKSTEEKLSHAEGKVQEEECKSASLEAQVAFLQQLSKSEQEKMEGKLMAVTEEKNQMDEEMMELFAQCLELVSVVKNREMQNGSKDEESSVQPSSDDGEEGTFKEALETLSALVQDSFQKNSQEKQEMVQQIMGLQEQNKSARGEISQLSDKLKASERQARNLTQELSKERQIGRASCRERV